MLQIHQFQKNFTSAKVNVPSHYGEVIELTKMLFGHFMKYWWHYLGHTKVFWQIFLSIILIQNITESLNSLILFTRYYKISNLSVVAIDKQNNIKNNTLSRFYDRYIDTSFYSVYVLVNFLTPLPPCDILFWKMTVFKDNKMAILI